MITPASIRVKRLGGFHVGGETVTVSGREDYDAPLPDGSSQRISLNGEFSMGQMYVQYTLQESPRSRYPLLLWHGGGLSGTTWEDTPDGRPGWQWFFLSHGHDVYVSDAFERGRANWPRFPDIFPGYPEFRDRAKSWTWFRCGPRYHSDPEKREIYPGQQFPAESFDAFSKQTAPRWRQSNPWIENAYAAYLERFSTGCVVLSHSQGGYFSTGALWRFSQSIKAHISLEPFYQGPPHAGRDMERIRHIPQLIIWGDYIDSDPAWIAQRKLNGEYVEAARAAGADATLIDLPAIGIRGNSHMIHNDRNSDQIAAVVQNWMRERGLADDAA